MTTAHTVFTPARCSCLPACGCRLAQDGEAQQLLREYRPQIQAIVKKLSGDIDVDRARVDYKTAIHWLDECGIFGECSVQLPEPLYADSIPKAKPASSVSSLFTIELAREAFIHSMPAQASVSTAGTVGTLVSLKGVRQFQEWLARCAEIKYSGLFEMPIIQRIQGLLDNLFSDHRPCTCSS